LFLFRFIPFYHVLTKVFGKLQLSGVKSGQQTLTACQMTKTGDAINVNAGSWYGTNATGVTNSLVNRCLPIPGSVLGV